MNIFEEEEEEIEKRNNRKLEFSNTIKKNYNRTFVKNLEGAVNKRFAKGDIEKIVLNTGNTPGFIISIDLLDKNGRKLDNKEIEEKIIRFWKARKSSLERNSDYYFKERKKINQKQNIMNRSLGESLN